MEVGLWRALVILPVLLAGLVVSGTGRVAHAAAGAGVSAECDQYGHCVEGGGTSANAGVNLDLAGSDLGRGAALCHGTANGAVLMEITCAFGTQSRTMAFPGTAGAVPVVAPTATLSRVPLCWTVVGYFANLSGSHYEVDLQGCVLVML